MFKSLLLPAALLASFCIAQDTTTTTSTATSTQDAAAATSSAAGDFLVQIVQVSDFNGTLRYFPEDIQAQPGSIVQFQFNPKNHTITQSDFGHPCQPITQTSPLNLTETRPGIDSGFVPVSNTSITNSSGFSGVPVYNMLINDTAPIWLYCAQGPHCSKGMSMVINQNRSDTVNKTLTNYKLAAALIAVNSTNSSTTSSSSTTTTTSTISSTTASTTTTFSPTVVSISSTTTSGPPIATSNAAVKPGLVHGGAVVGCWMGAVAMGGWTLL